VGGANIADKELKLIMKKIMKADKKKKKRKEKETKKAYIQTTQRKQKKGLLKSV
jgi:hypothetical protein